LRGSFAACWQTSANTKSLSRNLARIAAALRLLLFYRLPVRSTLPIAFSAAARWASRATTTQAEQQVAYAQ
jgi:hypothetical protein